MRNIWDVPSSEYKETKQGELYWMGSRFCYSTRLDQKGRNHIYSFHHIAPRDPRGVIRCAIINWTWIWKFGALILSQNWMNFKKTSEAIKNDWFLIEFHSSFNIVRCFYHDAGQCERNTFDFSLCVDYERLLIKFHILLESLFNFLPPFKSFLYVKDFTLEIGVQFSLEHTFLVFLLS